MRPAKRTALQFAVSTGWLLGICGAALAHEMGVAAKAAMTARTDCGPARTERPGSR